MAELDRLKASPSNAGTVTKSRTPEPTPASRPDSTNPTSLEPEGDLERVVSQAALYISELGVQTRYETYAKLLFLTLAFSNFDGRRPRSQYLT